MKKILFILSVLLMCSCTDNMMTRNWGGKTEMDAPKGQRVIMITFKGDDIWILTEPMDSDYVPKTKKFYESSSWNLYEGEITIRESR